MNQMLARSAMHIAGPVTAEPTAPRSIRFIPRPFPFPLRPISLPLAASRNGNLFVDRNDSALRWYLPVFQVAPDIDPSFTFAASQTGQLSNGQPYNVARLTLRVVKSRPADVTQFAQNNPGARMQEIPLQNLAAVLKSPYTDQNGQQQDRTFLATSITDLGDGSFQLLFDGTILGDSVIALYQDLRLFGKAGITLSGGFETWSTPGAPPSPGNLKISMLAFPAARFANTTPAHTAPTSPSALRFRPGVLTPATIAAHPVSTTTAPEPAPPQLVEAALPFTTVVPLGLKYNLDGYQLRYTVSTSTSQSRVIVSAADLNSFNTTQSQFTELKELGDISLKYPSLNRAYMGVISRTIVLIPQRYSIMRSKAGCAATCLARVDSSAASVSQCAFEFSFVIAPEVNRVELAKLQNEIQGIADLNGYQITFPDFLRDNPASTLLTSFKTSAQFAPGSDPHTFAVTVSVQDDGPNTPAVANANLFILRLCAQTGTDLIGSLSLKLDDGFTDPVPATIDLNFAHTAGSNDLTAETDTTASSIILSNISPLNLQIQECALLQGSDLTEVPGQFQLAAQSSCTLPLPANSSTSQLLAVAQLELPSPMSISAAAQFLTFQTVDVQQTQYVVAIDASGVDFDKVKSIAVSISFPTLPAIAPLQLNLSSNLRADSGHVLIPLANAIFTLPASANLSVSFVDPSVSPIEFTLANDFATEPVLTVLQNQITEQVPATT